MPLSLVVFSIVVALRKESVDRNAFGLSYFYIIKMSLSARRAWIEITGTMGKSKRAMSLSARRAWIEITFLPIREALN